MMLNNYTFEEKLMNGSIVKIMKIIYDDSCGPTLDWILPLHIVVDFPESTLNHISIEGYPTTYIHIPITNNRCEKCCFTYTISLEVCKVNIIYKSHGITLSLGKLLKKVVVWLSTESQRKIPEAELLEFSRAIDPEMIATVNLLYSIDWAGLFWLGKWKTRDKRREFKQSLSLH